MQTGFKYRKKLPLTDERAEQQYHIPERCIRLHRKYFKQIIFVVLVIFGLCLAAIGTMFFLFPLQDAGKITNVCFSILGLILLILLYRGSLMDATCYDMKSILYRSSLFFIGLQLTSDAALLFFAGNPEHTKVIFSLNELIFLTNMLADFAFSCFYFTFYCMKPKAFRFLFCFFVICTVLYLGTILCNPVTGWYYTVDAQGKLVYPDTYHFTYAYYVPWNLFHIVSILVSRRTLRTKITLLSYIVMIVAAMVVDLFFLPNGTNMEAIILPYCGIVSMLAVFSNVLVQRNHEILQWKAKQQELQTETLLSNIQPHFIFNVMNSIMYLCEEDARKAKDALFTFSLYLRGNLNAVNATGMVAFSQELECLRQYLELEKLRFGERIQVEWEIETTAFTVPAMTIQPLVENAIKHGLCHKKEGGTIFITAREQAACYEIIVRDTGNGFDTAAVIDESHFGLKLVRTKLSYACGGTLHISSVPGNGTTCVVQIPKEEKGVGTI